MNNWSSANVVNPQLPSLVASERTVLWKPPDALNTAAPVRDKRKGGEKYKQESVKRNEPLPLLSVASPAPQWRSRQPNISGQPWEIFKDHPSSTWVFFVLVTLGSWRRGKTGLYVHSYKNRLFQKHTWSRLNVCVEVVQKGKKNGEGVTG